MAYDRQKLYDEALVLLDAYEIIYIEELSIELGINKSTFYDFWPVDSDEYNELKKRIMKNKTHLKRELRREFKMGSPAEKIALYKLAATSEELQALNGQYVDHTSKGEKINITPIQFNNDAKND